MTGWWLTCREQPIFSTKAHVFHIDPKTKRSWIPASSQAVSVSFFYDSSRNLYRIISVEGTKAVINSTITPNMTFTKTSQKFGQWSDIRANTVYGLGFGSEPDLNKVSRTRSISDCCLINVRCVWYRLLVNVAAFLLCKCCIYSFLSKMFVHSAMNIAVNLASPIQ